jgi:hypothetical protein
MAKRRFYSSLDMAIVKKDIATRNSQFKRGELKERDNRISPCSCGTVGCFNHFHAPTIPRN